MNQDQMLGILRLVLPVIVPLLVSKGYVPSGAASDITTAVLALGAAGWSWASHTDSAKIAAVTAMPEIAKVVVAVTAPPTSAAATAAADAAQTKVTKS